MRFYLLSDNNDTLMGMRLAGIEGEVIHEREELEDKMRAVIADTDIAVVLVTNKITQLAPDIIHDMKLHHKQPLIVEVPDRHGAGQLSDSITQYVKEAVGISI